MIVINVCWSGSLLSSQNAASAYPDIEDLETVLELLPYTISGYIGVVVLLVLSNLTNRVADYVYSFEVVRSPGQLYVLSYRE